MALVMKLEQVIKSKRPAGAAAPAPTAPAPAPASPAKGGFKSDALFQEIKNGISADPSLVKKINGVYQFVITDGPDSAKKEWTVDLKNGLGSVAAAKAEKSDVTITLSDENFVSLADGKANAQQLFMQGKVKLTGNMALAMKLEQVIKAKKSSGVAATAPAPVAPAAPELECDSIFPAIAEGIKADPDLVKRVNGVFEFTVTGKGDAKNIWYVDLKTPPGKVFKGPASDVKVDCFITLSDENFVNMVNGKGNAQQLFMQGKIKFRGNLALAMKLEQVFKAKASL